MPFHCFDFEMIQSPLLYDTKHSTYAIYREVDQPGTCDVAYPLTLSYTVRF
jgi:hypothetical protein